MIHEGIDKRIKKTYMIVGYNNCNSLPIPSNIHVFNTTTTTLCLFIVAVICKLTVVIQVKTFLLELDFCLFLKNKTGLNLL